MACIIINNIDDLGEFKSCLRYAADQNKKEFEFQGKKYPVTIYNDCVQTLINDRILYRIYLVEEKEIGHNLASIVNF